MFVFSGDGKGRVYMTDLFDFLETRWFQTMKEDFGVVIKQ
jgi:hypothetical protein